MVTFYIGTAGWSLRTEQQPLFEAGSSHLARYATQFAATEINSSFYRPHRFGTYARWADTVPDEFRFCVKVPKTVTHEKRLAKTGALLKQFLCECGGLGAKLGPLLVQLPPGLAYDQTTARAFFKDLRARHQGAIVLEARHASWFVAKADSVLSKYGIARVIADPPKGGAAQPGKGISYWRLHGSPKIYCSGYSVQRLKAYAADMKKAQAAGSEVWCMFDNTLGPAIPNALALMQMLARSRR